MKYDPRTIDARTAEAVRKAKTGREMLESWDGLTPGTPSRYEERMSIWGAYVEKAPHILDTFGHKPLLQVLERKVLDPKTRELILVGILATRESSFGIATHAQAAMQMGATEEEIIEVIFLSVYEAAKGHMAKIGPALNKALKPVEAKVK